MERSEGYTLLLAPREGVNDDVVRVIEWLAAEGARVEGQKPVVVLETTKSTFELEAPAAGYLFPLARVGEEVPVGSPLALLADRPERPPYKPRPAAQAATAPLPAEQVITKKARALIEERGLSDQDFAALPVVRASDVEEVLARRAGPAPKPAARTFRGEELDPAADWDAVLQTDFFDRVRELLTALRKRMKARYNRHVSTSDLLHDRWDLAREYGFGEGTSVYDECLILGDVQIGKHCWVGPYTILDGQAPLKIGDYVDVGAGTHIYTHNTIERALTGHKAPLFRKATTIGNCCFIAPNVTVAPGTVVGDHSFVAAGSYVEGTFPPFSYIAGNPAKRVGVVEIRDGQARIRRFQAGEQGA